MDGFTFTPTVGILLTVVGSVTIVFVSIFTYFCMKQRSNSTTATAPITANANGKPNNSGNRTQALNNSNNPGNGRPGGYGSSMGTYVGVSSTPTSVYTPICPPSGPGQAGLDPMGGSVLGPSDSAQNATNPDLIPIGKYQTNIIL